jgi:hypothetical protein
MYNPLLQPIFDLMDKFDAWWKKQKERKFRDLPLRTKLIFYGTYAVLALAILVELKYIYHVF